MNVTLVHLLFMVQLECTLFMVGVIWFVQVVHYPLFAKIGTMEFPEYERAHTSRTKWVVAPPMLLELGTASLLVWSRPEGVSGIQSGIGLALLGVIWLSTMFLQVPSHESLSRGFDPIVHKRLVSTNWLRVGAWSLRGLLVLSMAWSMKG